MTDMHITDDLIDAALDAVPYLWSNDMLALRHMRKAIAAALAAAPAVDDVVKCEYMDEVVERTTNWCLAFEGNDCPGPHRTLILGPEVTP